VRREERARIARELHDGIGQELSAASLLLRAALSRGIDAESAIKQDLSEISSVMGRASDLCRSMIRGLAMNALGESTLEDALQALARRKAHIYGAAVDARITKGIAEKLSYEHSQELFLVAQEALRNACEHAQAKLVVLRFSQIGTRICLEVSDDGRGIPSRRSPDRGTGGLKIMRQRANRIGASLSIRRANPRGTLVRCVL